MIARFARYANATVVRFSDAAASRAARCRARAAELRRHEIDEGAHLRRQMPGRRIDEPDRRRFRLELVQHGNELAASDFAVEVILMQLRQPVAGASRFAQRTAVAEAHGAVRRERGLGAANDETPRS